MARKTKNNKPQTLSSDLLKSKLLSAINTNSKKRYTPKQLKRKLSLENSTDSISSALNQLASEGKILALKENIFKANRNAIPPKPKATATHIGKLDLTRSGSGFVIVEGLEQDIFISANNINGAFDGDEVSVKISKQKSGRRPDGKIIKVISRKIKQLVGKIVVFKKLGIVNYSGKNGELDIFIKSDDLNGAENGDSVLVTITSWGNANNSKLWGSIASILTETDAHNMAMQQILVDNGFDLQFPDHVLKEANHLERAISQEEINLRRDLRKTTTLTIDPLTAQDFDDALSIEKLENGNWEVGVHIADVSHYVQPDTAIDKEAFSRSTSVYLVDRCIPMLPEVLSNKLCSLRPNEDSLTFSAMFEFDDKYKIVKEWYGKTIIHSDRRFTYEEAQEIIETTEGEYATEILTLDKIAKKLRKQKFKNGAIAFESDEVQFKLDEDNKPIDIYVKKRKDAHLLVEDFMLLANKAVATFIINKSKKAQEVPFVYRVHDTPNEEKLEDFGLFAKELGFPMKLDTPKNVAKSFNDLAKEAQTNEVVALMQPMAIRTMSKAIYTTENIGHYGLAFDNYTHFTSPIRRYSDLLVHRILAKNLEDNYNRVKKADLEAKCGHISTMEKKAMTAERDSIKYKQVEYLMDKVGQTFEGFISGIIDQGIFIELKESKAEGLIGFNQFTESYEIASSRLYAIGNKSGTRLAMGTKVKVELLDTNIELKQIDLKLVEVIKS